MTTVNVDQVTGYALVDQPLTVQVDQVSAYALITEKVVLTYTIEVKQHVANSLNKIHNLSLGAADFDLVNPVVKADATYNASVHATFKPSSGFSGSVDLSYNRTDLADLVVARDLDTLRYDGAMTRTPQAVTAFNAKYGTKLTADDVVDAPIPQGAPCVLEAAPTSIWFVPGTTVSIGYLSPSDRDWEIEGLVWPATSATLPNYLSPASFVTRLGTLLGRTLDPAKVTFSADIATSTGAGTNREIMRDASYPSVDGLSTLTHKVYYNRLDLAGMSAYTFPTTTKIGEDTTVHHVLGALSKVTGIPFTTADLEDTSVIAQDSLDTFTIPLQARAGSPLFKGNYTLTVGRKIALSTIFTTLNLGSV